MKRRVIVGLLWTSSLVLVATAARAQRIVPPVGREPEVISGGDIGFRVDRYDGDTPIGDFVVRRDGKWVAVQFSARIKPTR